MAASRLRVGIIGTGWVATARHIPCFQRIPGVEVVAVLDRDLDRARDVASRFKIGGAFDESEPFYSFGLDIVSICTPPATHAATAVAALNHGCHVFVEKPMALSVAEAKWMLETTQASGRLICVSHNLLYSRSMRKIKEMGASGVLGDIRQVIGFQLSSPSRRLPVWYPELPGGLFFDEAPHLLYLMRHFLGDAPLSLAAVNRAEDGDAIRSVVAKFQGATAEGILNMSFDSPVSEWMLTIVGSRRVVIFDIFRDIVTCLRPDGKHSGKDILKTMLLAGTDFASGFLTSGFLHSTGRLFYGHEKLIEGFVTSIRNGDPEAPITAADGLDVVSSIEQILLSDGKDFSLEVAR